MDAFGIGRRLIGGKEKAVPVRVVKRFGVIDSFACEKADAFSEAVDLFDLLSRFHASDPNAIC